MWNLNSRIHLLKQFPKDCYVKREDELSCSISGTKLRKYASLVPFWKAMKLDHLVVIAGPQSNNLLAAAQLAREMGIKISAFLIRPWQEPLKGNYQFSRLFLDEADIHWIEREQWSQVESIARTYANQLGEIAYVLKEGASVPEAMPGAMTLGDDILRNEAESGIRFSHIFMDAGTGFSAAGLIKSLEEQQHPADIHVLVLADDEQTFLEKLKAWTTFDSHRLHVFSPSTAKAFGAVNQTIKQEIYRIAREEGFLLDPIYSAKLFHEARKKILAENLQGPKLIIHSGGLLTLAGFELNRPA